MMVDLEGDCVWQKRQRQLELPAAQYQSLHCRLFGLPTALVWPATLPQTFGRGVSSYHHTVSFTDPQPTVLLRRLKEGESDDD